MITSATPIASNDNSMPRPVPGLASWKSNFNLADVPDATELDYSVIPFDPSDENWGFNDFFYEFKCRNPADPQQALFIKRNEIPALKKKALLSNTYMISHLDMPRDVKRLRVCECLYVTKDLEFCAQRVLTSQQETFRLPEQEGLLNMPYSKEIPTKTLLWPTVAQAQARYYYNMTWVSWGCAYVLFYMGVKYGSQCTQALYDEIVGLHKRQHLYKKARSEKIEKAREDARKGKQMKLKILLYRTFFKKESAKLAYAMGLHPEDDVVSKQAENEFHKCVIQSRVSQT